jgi:hypothetical protein
MKSKTEKIVMQQENIAKGIQRRTEQRLLIYSTYFTSPVIQQNYHFSLTFMCEPYNCIYIIVSLLS